MLMVFINYWGIIFSVKYFSGNIQVAKASSQNEKESNEKFSFELDDRPVYKMLNANENNSIDRIQKMTSNKKISICIAGEVNYPGQFYLPAGSSIVDGIKASGGLSRLGSLRNIKILKDNNSCQKVDLYSYVSTELNKAGEIVLGDGDTVVVPEAEVLVEISGHVSKPGVYELKNLERSLGWLLKMCSFKSSEKKNYKIDIHRYQDDFYKNIVSQKIDKRFFGNEISGFLLENRDKIEILVETGNLEKTVELRGHFRYPGKVVLKSKTYLSEMITRQNLMYGFAKDYAEVLRVNDQKEEYEVLSFSPEALLKGDRSADFQLKNGDRIMVFSQALFNRGAKVAIEGDVLKAGKYQWREGLRVADLVKAAGGLKKGAAKIARIERRSVEDGKLRKRTVIVNLEKALNNNSRYNLYLKPFDLLVCASK